MIFSSASFLCFLAALLIIYPAARSKTQRATVLLVASILFYASWKPVYLILLGASLAVNYVIYNALLARRSRALLTLGITLNLLVLGVVKYLALFVESALWTLARLDLATTATPPAWLSWALPLGISFYTFHMLSALIDVYRGVWAKPVSFKAWCLYVTFFPHLIAGPILRPGQLIDQLGDLTPLNAKDLRLGGLIFAAGLAKKVLLADNLALIADKLYDVPAQLDFATAWIGTLAFAFQIYFDFSGYSEMAIGLARMFGVDVAPQLHCTPISAGTRPNSGGAGTSPCRSGCATTSTSRLGGYSREPMGDLPQPDGHHAAGRSLARRQLDVRVLGRPARSLPRRPPPAESGFRSVWHRGKFGDESDYLSARLAVHVRARVLHLGVLPRPDL